MRRELREWGWMALGFSACLLVAGIGAVVWGNHIEHRIDRVVIGRHHDHHELRRVTAELGDAREVQANSEPGTPRTTPAPQGQQPPSVPPGGSVAPPAARPPKPQGPPSQAEPPPDEADSEVVGPAAGTETSTATTTPEVDQGGGQETSLVKPVLGVVPPIGSTAEQVGETADHALCPVNALGIRVCTE